MSTFCINLDKNSIAKQLAHLININNKLTRIHTVSSIFSSNAKYLLEFGGYNIRNSNKEKVIVGCIGMELLQPNITMLKHLSVHNKFRNNGIASDLLNNALKECTTNDVRMRIRSDNYPSLKLAEKFGFVYLFNENLGDYYILTVGRNLTKWQK